jgi:hypothetical protein
MATLLPRFAALSSFIIQTSSFSRHALRTHQTSNYSNGVSTLGQGADDSYNQNQMQDVLNKLDELIKALRW